MRLWLAVALCASAALAQDAQLNRLRATMRQLAAPHEVDLKTRGRPALTTAKHQLRDWIESQLAKFKPGADTHAFQAQLNKALEKVSSRSDDEQDASGQLADMRIEGVTGGLVVQTGIGIPCGFDDSAYLYRWQSGRWVRAWESEQNDYREGSYRPQSIRAVKVTQGNVLTVGVNPWCTSNWQSSYFRVWSLGTEPPKVIFDKTAEFTFVGDDLPVGGLTKDDIQIEFATTSIDPGFNRGVVERYLIGDDLSLRRVDPVAFTPRGFVEEWISRTWEEITPWSSPALLEQHARLKGMSGQFDSPPMHCPAQPDLWQVGIDDDGKKTYFLVRWRPPHRFTMTEVRKTPDPRCTEPDPDAEGER